MAQREIKLFDMEKKPYLIMLWKYSYLSNQIFTEKNAIVSEVRERFLVILSCMCHKARLKTM